MSWFNDYYKQLESLCIIKKDTKCYDCKHQNDIEKCKTCSGSYLDNFERE